MTRRSLIEHRIEARPQVIRLVIEIDRDTALWQPQFPKHWRAYQDIVSDELDQVLANMRSESDAVEEGVVHWFDDAKGYGYITAYDARDVFVHWKGIQGTGYRTLESGQRVQFKRRMGRLSVEAFDVLPCQESKTSSPT